MLDVLLADFFRRRKKSFTLCQSDLGAAGDEVRLPGRRWDDRRGPRLERRLEFLESWDLIGTAVTVFQAFEAGCTDCTFPADRSTARWKSRAKAGHRQKGSAGSGVVGPAAGEPPRLSIPAEKSSGIIERSIPSGRRGDITLLNVIIGSLAGGENERAEPCQHLRYSYATASAAARVNFVSELVTAAIDSPIAPP